MKASSGGGRSSARETIGLYTSFSVFANPRDLSLLLGRVAAGAIAEHYLNKVYGIEIVAFVSSVGKIHLPDTIAPPSLTSLKGGKEEDEVEDALSPEFRKLLATINREEVDKYPTRCPHQETSDEMTRVNSFQIHFSRFIFSDMFCRELSAQKTNKIQSAERSLASSGTFLLVSENPVLISLKPNWLTPCYRYPPPKRSRSAPASAEPRSRAANTTTCSSRETMGPSSPQQTGVGAFRVVSPTVPTSTSGSASNPQLPSPSNKKLPNTTELREPSPPAEGTIPVSSPEPSLSSRPWPHWSSWINFSSRTRARPRPACSLPSPPCHPRWSCPRRRSDHLVRLPRAKHVKIMCVQPASL